MAQEPTNLTPPEEPGRPEQQGPSPAPPSPEPGSAPGEAASFEKLREPFDAPGQESPQPPAPEPLKPQQLKEEPREPRPAQPAPPPTPEPLRPQLAKEELPGAQPEQRRPEPPPAQESAVPKAGAALDGAARQEPEPEKKDLLKREEVRTMVKDLAKARRMEAEGVRERIASPPEPSRGGAGPETKEGAPFLEADQEQKAPLAAPRPQTSRQKVAVRALVIGIVLFIAANLALFGWWFFTQRDQGGLESPEALQETGAQEESPTLPRAASGEEPEPEEPAFQLIVQDRLATWGFETPGVPRAIRAIILHSSFNILGEDPHELDGILRDYQAHGVTPHYIIERDGTVWRLAPDEVVAYQAGQGTLQDGTTRVNEVSLGVELVYTKLETPSEAQLQAAAALVARLQATYGIPGSMVFEHSAISPGRKTDPWNFDAELFARLLKEQ